MAPDSDHTCGAAAALNQSALARDRRTPGRPGASANAMTEPLAWINDRRVPFSDAAVPVWDLGVVAGASVSELARTFAQRLFRPDEHLARLRDSCDALGVTLGYSNAQLAAVAQELVEVNATLISPAHDLGVVWFATAGANPTYGQGGDAAGQGGDAASGTVGVHTFPLPLAAWRDAMEHGVRLTIPEQRQIPEACLPVRHKVRNRLHWWLADRAANAEEPGSRALLTNDSGHLTETSTAAIHLVVDGHVQTPNRDVLRSLSSRVAEQLCRQEGIAFQRTSVPEALLESASEAFLTSSASGLLPVRTVNRRAVGTECPAPVTRRLQRAWSELVGIDIVEQIRRCPGD